MRQPLPNLDPYASFRIVEAQVEQAVKAGALTREKAAQILRDAKKNYSKNEYNRHVDAVNRVDVK